MAQKKKKDGKRPLLSTGTVARNRRARHDYTIEEELEVGLVLTGTEVKSLRRGAVNLAEAHAGLKKGELYLLNLHIGDWPHAPRALQHEPTRPRKILVHRRERDHLAGAVKQKGMALVPLSLFFNRRGLVKLSLGLGRGKRAVDKRDTLKERDWQRKKGRLMRELG